MPIDQHPARRRPYDAANYADERCLARSIWPEQGEDLAASDREVDSLERSEARGILFGEAADLDDVVHDRQDNLAHLHGEQKCAGRAREVSKSRRRDVALE